MNDTKIADFVTQMAELQFLHTFNPYADVCLAYDLPDAPAIRRANLTAVLTAACTTGVNSLWVARDLGYKGGRRTGLALTDELHLTHHATLLGSAPLQRATRGEVFGERTATVVWGVLAALKQPVFLWNLFPLHPHAPGDALTNRCHTRQERDACRFSLDWLMSHLQPKQIIAIGRDAQSGLTAMGITHHPIRHPSYGGQTDFLNGLALLYPKTQTPQHLQGVIEYKY